MTEYIEMRTDTDRPVTFEVDDFDGPVPAGRRWDATAERVASTIEEGVETIKELARSVATRIADMTDRPDKITVELGVKVSAEAGVVVAKSTADAHIKVSLEWGRSKPPIEPLDAACR